MQMIEKRSTFLFNKENLHFFFLGNCGDRTPKLIYTHGTRYQQATRFSALRAFTFGLLYVIC